MTYFLGDPPGDSYEKEIIDLIGHDVKTVDDLVEKWGAPTWEYEGGLELVWDLHPEIWDGQLTLFQHEDGKVEVRYCYDQGGAL